MARTELQERQRALVHARWYIALVLATGWAFEAMIIALDGLGLLSLVLLMWLPGLVCLSLRGLFRIGFSDVGLSPGALRFHGLALLIPVVVAAECAGIAVAFDLRRFAPPGLSAIAALAPDAALLLAAGAMGAIGEELGWRGFLLPRLLRAGHSHAIALTGIVWALWHLPVVAFGGFYGPGSSHWMAAVYVIGILAMNPVLCAIRLRAASFWVAASLHMWHNFVFQFVLPVMVLTLPGTAFPAWDALVGDTGLLIASGYLLVRIVLARSAR